MAIADRDGTVVAEHDRAYGDAPTDTTDPASQLPLLCNKLRGWHESKVRANLPDGLRSYMDGLDRRGLGDAARALRDQCAESGWDGAVEAAESSLERCGRIDRAAMSLAAKRQATGSISYDDAVDLAAYDRPLEARRHAHEGR